MQSIYSLRAIIFNLAFGASSILANEDLLRRLSHRGFRFPSMTGHEAQRRVGFRQSSDKVARTGLGPELDRAGTRGNCQGPGSVGVFRLYICRKVADDPCILWTVSKSTPPLGAGYYTHHHLAPLGVIAAKAPGIEIPAEPVPAKSDEVCVPEVPVSRPSWTPGVDAKAARRFGTPARMVPSVHDSRFLARSQK